MLVGFKVVLPLVMKRGYIDKTGSFVINPQFDYAGNFAKNGLAWVEVGEKYGYIDKSGSLVIDPQFDWAGDFGNLPIRTKRQN